MHPVDLNIDVGELPDESEELYPLATVVNIACGGHAGDLGSMRRSVELALRAGARIAAHPSYADREQFGRARMAIPLSVLYESVVEQVDALAHVARGLGATLWGAKPHGALYHACSEDSGVAAAVLDAVVAAWPDGLTIVGPPAGHLADASGARALAYVREGFADRRYDDGGRLLARGEPGALITDAIAAAEQAVQLAATGEVETVCVHADTPNALAIARAVHGALLAAKALRPRVASP